MFDSIEAIESFGANMLAELGSREAVSIACGYYPAWKAWDLKETYGLPLVVTAMRCKQKGLKMDWGGIALEAARRGADVDAEIAEAKHELLLVA